MRGGGGLAPIENQLSFLISLTKFGMRMISLTKFAMYELKISPLKIPMDQFSQVILRHL